MADPKLLEFYPSALNVYTIQSTKDLKKTLFEADKDIVMVMEFIAEWCEPCIYIDEILESWARLYEGSMVVLRVDVDNLEDSVHEYHITSVPTFIFMRDRKQLERISDSSLNKLRDAVKKHCGLPTGGSSLRESFNRVRSFTKRDLEYSADPERRSAHEVRFANEPRSSHVNSSLSAESVHSNRQRFLENNMRSFSEDSLVSNVHTIHFKEDLQKLLSEAHKDILILMEFFSAGCERCIFTGAALESWARLYEGKMIVIKIDVNSIGDAVNEYNIKNLPTFIFVRNRKQLDRFFGISLNKLRDAIMMYCGLPIDIPLLREWSSSNGPRSSKYRRFSAVLESGSSDERDPTPSKTLNVNESTISTQTKLSLKPATLVKVISRIHPTTSSETIASTQPTTSTGKSTATKHRTSNKAKASANETATSDESTTSTKKAAPIKKTTFKE